MNPLKRYALGLGENRAIQEAVDYGAGALTVGGLTALGNTLGDPSRADQNVLLQGLLGAPMGAATLRAGRGKAANAYTSSKIGNGNLEDSMGKFKALAPDQQERIMKVGAMDWANNLLLESQMKNPYTQAALSASGGSIFGSMAGRVFDNDAVGSSVGLAALASIAPITYSMYRNRGANVAGSAKAVYNMPENSTGKYNVNDYHGVPPGYPRASANPDNRYQPDRPAPTTPFRTVDVSAEPVARPSILDNLPQGVRGGDLAVVPRNSVVTVPPRSWDELGSTLSSNSYLKEVKDKLPYELGLSGAYLSR